MAEDEGPRVGRPGRGGLKRRAAQTPMTAATVVDHPALAAMPRPARPKARHRAALAGWLLAVVAPTLGAIAYLYLFASDQYASTAAFSVRGPEAAAPAPILGMLGQPATPGATDAEIVYEFIRSQPMVESARAALPLDEIFNRAPNDPLFRLGENRSIERMTEYWNRMVFAAFDSTTGLIQVQVRSFDPESARDIAAFVLQESARVVNELSIQAQADALSVASAALAESEERLRAARRAIRVFRDAERELNPELNAQASLGLMAGLREQLAAAQVELDGYLTLVGPQGPRTAALRQRVESLRQQIEEERARVSVGAGAGTAVDRPFSVLMGEFEELSLDLEFAQNAYVAALAALEQARIEARRRTRFLAPHIEPTLSVEAQYPQRAFIAFGLFVILTVAWSVVLLIAYNVRDRR